jgi:ADP-heptose:LPS heptosyltransferase
MGYIFKKKRYAFFVFLIDLIGSIIFLPFRIFKKRKPGNIANILVIRLDHIGDVIFSTAVARNLKEHYKGAKVTFLVGSFARGVVMDNTYIDEVICYDAPWFSRKGRRIFEFARFFKLANELKKHNYDLGIDLRGDFRHIVLMALSDIKFRIGYGITGGGFLLNRRVKYREGVHAIEHNLDLLRGMSVDIIANRPKIYVSKENEQTASDIISGNSLTKEDFITIIHTTAGYRSKNWLDYRFAELIEVISRKYKSKIVLIGSDGDKEKNGRILELSGVNGVNLSGETSLPVLTALIKRASLFIGVDSGPAHIAALEDIPSVVLYSGTNIADEWAGIGDKVVKIQKDISCKGCGKLDCEDNICMDLISVEDVVDAVEEVLGKVM